MEATPSKFGLAISLVAGISGIYLITRTKTGNTVTTWSSNAPLPSSNYFQEAEIIGDYIGHGHAGSVFHLPSGDVLKVVSLENDMLRGDGIVNREQSEFIEDLWIKKLEGKDSFIPEFAEIKHYHRGFAGPKITELVNSESPSFKKRPIKVGEQIAYWVMEYIPTIGDGEMSKTRISEAKTNLRVWANNLGYELSDIHEGNYGERADGSFVAFDPWPEKISQDEV